MAIKNQAITMQFVAWDTGNNIGKTGDEGNFTLKLVQDGVAASPIASASEVDATNCPGVYSIALTAAEMNYDWITLCGKSTTSNIVIIPVNLSTQVSPNVYLDNSLSTHTYTVLDGDGDGIADVLVEARQSDVVIQTARTNASGVATFYLVAGTYDFYAAKAGYSFTNPDSETVS